MISLIQNVSLTFFLFCAGAIGVNCTLSVKPLNDAVMVGSTVELRCAVNSSASRVYWFELAYQPWPEDISDGKNIRQAHPQAARYSILGGELDFNLQIRNVSLSDGGRYFCQDINQVPPTPYYDNWGYTDLIVLDGDPVCQDFVTVTGVALEGRNYWTECKLGYKGNIAPIMEWTGPGNLVNSSTTPEFVWSRASFKADRSMDGEMFTCHTSFPPIENLPNPSCANNTPTYEHTYKSSPLQVRWKPLSMKITPIKTEYVVGDVLKCSADSNPTPTYTWTNMRTLEQEPPGAKFKITEELAESFQPMRCHAEVNIEGKLYSNDVTVHVTVL